MKKVLLSILALMMAMSVNAQRFLNESDTPFKQGKFYVNASLPRIHESSARTVRFLPPAFA